MYWVHALPMAGSVKGIKNSHVHNVTSNGLSAANWACHVHNVVQSQEIPWVNKNGTIYIHLLCVLFSVQDAVAQCGAPSNLSSDISWNLPSFQRFNLSWLPLDRLNLMFFFAIYILPGYYRHYIYYMNFTYSFHNIPSGNLPYYRK